VLQNQQLKEANVKGPAKTVALLLSKPAGLEKGNIQHQKAQSERSFDFDKRYNANDLLKGAVNMKKSSPKLEVESEKRKVESLQTGGKRKYTPICYILEDISPPQATVLQSASVSMGVQRHDRTVKPAEGITLIPTPQSE
jgi:hypothetical protein